MENFLLNDLALALQSGFEDNEFAVRLYNFIEKDRLNTVSRKDAAAFLLSGQAQKADIQTNYADQGGNEFCDMRFLNLALQNVKKYPGKENGVYYGISFSNEGKPLNSIFLGSNGVGKTSLYAALEYTGIRKMNTAAVRGYTRRIGQIPDMKRIVDDDQSKFLSHSGSTLTDAAIGLKTMSGLMSIEGEKFLSESLTPLVPDAFYCSDFDVRILEACSDLSTFMLNQIGLGDYYKCLQLLYFLRGYAQEMNRLWGNYKNRVGSRKDTSGIYRLIFGIASGAVGCPGSDYFLKHGISIAELQIMLENNDLDKEFLNELRSWLKQEIKHFPANNWYSRYVNSRYNSALNNLRTLIVETDLNNVTIGRHRESIRKFVLFREDLVSALASWLENHPVDSGRNVADVEAAMTDYIDSVNELSKATVEMKAIGPNYSNNRIRTFSKDHGKLLAFMENQLRNRLQGFSSMITDTIKNMLSDYFLEDNDEINVSFGFRSIANSSLSGYSEYSENNDGIIHHFVKFDIFIMSSRGNLDTTERYIVSPRYYLNTFKYKLFTVALKLAFCCVAKKIHNINYPLVIDDVFDSSDFSSRVGIRKFAKEMVEQHNRLLPDPEYAIQFVFFTQDDLIADQFERGVTDVLGQGSVKFGRIFDYHEADSNFDLVDITDTESGDTLNYCSLEDQVV